MFFFHSAPEEGLYCKPKYRAILFKIYSVLFLFGHICRWDQCAVHILYYQRNPKKGWGGWGGRTPVCRGRDARPLAYECKSRNLVCSRRNHKNNPVMSVKWFLLEAMKIMTRPRRSLPV